MHVYQNVLEMVSRTYQMLRRTLQYAYVGPKLEKDVTQRLWRY